MGLCNVSVVVGGWLKSKAPIATATMLLRLLP